jgi:heat shock protein HspQ
MLKPNLRKEKIMAAKPEIGDLVEDKISGYKGIVSDITVFVAGCERVGVKSQELHEGKLIDTCVFDSPNLKVIKSKVITPKKTKKQKYKLGDKLKCKLTGYTGVATSMTESISGTRRFGISPQKIQEGKPIDGYSFNEELVELVKEEIHKPEKRSRTGGDQVVPRSAF